jgi:dTDP-4-dehydrorhamnose 3,5-epimerase
MKINRFDFPDLLEITLPKFHDSRGCFQVTYNEKKFREEKISTNYVQDNESFSTKGVLRGLHFQKAPYAQGKLVRVLKGRVQDVVVDLREGSPTYKKWKSFIIDSESGNQLFVPAGFAHGFLALEESIFSYKCTNGYNKESECGILWDDKDLNIDWMLEPTSISEKDNKQPTLEEALLEIAPGRVHASSCPHSNKGVWENLCFCGALQYSFDG